MPIANMRGLLLEARAQGRAVGAFSVSSIEMIMGVVSAAEALRTPVILQVAQARLKATPLPVLGAAMRAAAAGASVPVGVHLDHGMTMDVIMAALDAGFTSVMFDGSAMSMRDNIDQTLRVISLARPYGAAVEAEIGRVGRTEGGEPSPAEYARPGDCVRFARETGVDALAVGIGNAHGVYAGTPDLQFHVLEKVQALIDTPLVLHGGTGISDGDFRRCIALGVHKINIATALFQAAAQAAAQNAEDGYFAMACAALEGAREVAKRHIRVFGVCPPQEGGISHDRAVSM